MPQREVVHVALGDVACHVSTHWINLEGLAATSTDENAVNAAVCTPTTTHFAHNHQIYVPRALLVGSNTAGEPLPSSFVLNDERKSQPSPQHSPASQPRPPPPDSSPQPPPHNVSHNSNEEYQSPLSSSPKTRAAEFQRLATDLAYSASSRYRVALPLQQQQQPKTYDSTGRHVNWDEEEEEEEDDDNDDDWKNREHQRKLEWERRYRPCQDALEDFWHTPGVDGIITTQPSSKASTTVDSSTPLPTPVDDRKPSFPPTHAQQQQGHNHWRDYLLPPFHPETCLEIPRRIDDFNNVETTQSYYTAVHQDADWIETVVWERIRKLLEDCDACQGLMLIQQSGDSGVFAGWGTALLHEWHDECANTCQWVIDITTCPQQDADETAIDTDSSKDASTMSFALNQQRQRRAVRNQVQQALALSDQSELADVYLPLQLPSSSNTSASGAASVGAALETATLPYRLAGGGNRSQLALQSYYSGSYSGSDPFGSAPNLSYKEFVRSMQRQSTSRNVLELDVVLPWSSKRDNLYARLQQGTSLERDQRMRQPGYGGGVYRPRDTLPGEWMTEHDISSNSNGILTSLSPAVTTLDTRNNDRSLHYHFSLSTGLRPTATCQTKSNYVRCIMEGMGIRFRPEQSMAAVVDQSLAQLTCNGYGAGSYWKSIFAQTDDPSATRNSKTSLPSMPMLAVLGNTTRSYSFLHQTAMSAQQIVAPRNKRSGNRSFYNRDAGMGVLPEVDDCHEAVAACLDLRDSYEPPQGSGLVMDEEGDYFDMS